jgi:ribose transport system permease protein
MMRQMRTEDQTPKDTQTAQATVAPGPLTRGRPKDLTTWGPVIAFVALIVLFGILRPSIFLSSGNIFSILNDQAILVMLAAGLTVVLLTGEFDLSITSNLTLTGVLSAGLVVRQDWPVLVVVITVLLVGAVIGLTNGLLVTYMRIPALIATLGVGVILEGLTLWYTNGETILFPTVDNPFIALGRTSLGEVQLPVIYAAVVSILLWTMLNYTPAGRYLHAIGGNRDASRLCGIRVERYVILAFVISGMCAALAAIAHTARAGSATPSAGVNFLLPAFAAAFLGSATLRRGEFHIVGTVIGVYLIATGSAGFVILGAPFYTRQLFSGAVLIIATAGARLLARD